MAGRIVLINPARHFIANAHGLGYLIPLGLVAIGGPLNDAGFTVRLIDHDLYGWSHRRLIQEISDFKADYLLLGHSGSTAAHKIVIKTIKAIHEKLPHIRVVYGGVYPSYADRVVMAECEEIDVIVRGEGEQTIVGLIRTWEQTNDLSYVDGITWRNGQEVIVNRSRTPIKTSTSTVLVGSLWIGRVTPCSGSATPPDCNSAAAVRSPAPTAGNGCSGKSGGIATRRMYWSN